MNQFRRASPRRSAFERSFVKSPVDTADPVSSTRAPFAPGRRAASSSSVFSEAVASVGSASNERKNADVGGGPAGVAEALAAALLLALGMLEATVGGTPSAPHPFTAMPKTTSQTSVRLEREERSRAADERAERQRVLEA